MTLSRIKEKLYQDVEKIKEADNCYTLFALYGTISTLFMADELTEDEYQLLSEAVGKEISNYLVKQYTGH